MVPEECAGSAVSGGVRGTVSSAGCCEASGTDTGGSPTSSDGRDWRWRTRFPWVSGFRNTSPT
eukprot:4730987-Pleurochrysis_carterae.AAC.1